MTSSWYLFEDSLRSTFERHLIGCPSLLKESMAYSLFSSGKRIRPRLLLAIGDMLKLPPNVSLPGAFAIEMLHCSTLIHDDLPCMDDDDYRRGRPSNHKQFDEATALLAGNALIALSSEVLLETPLSSSLVLNAQRSLLKALGAHGVIGGQASESSLHSKSSLDDLLQVHLKKTGALFHACIEIPQALAGLETGPKISALKQFGTEIGRAFQIADDLEDANEPLEPTSILTYLSADEARNQTVERLLNASREIQKVWLSEASLVVSITNEVVAKIQNTAESDLNPYR